MKYCIKCKVDGKIVIGREILIDYNNKEYLFIPDEKGLLVSIKITTRVKYPERFFSEIRPGEGKIKATFITGRDTELIAELKKEFQQIESDLTFLGSNLKRIHWEKPEEKIITETDEEREKVAINSIYEEGKYPDEPTNISEDTLRSIIEQKDIYNSLVIPKAFFREGINHFKLFDYIDAYYDFYYVFEGLYGAGKHGNNLLKQLKNDKEFRKIIDFVIKQFKNEPRHSDEIKKLLVETKVSKEADVNVDNMIKLLQKVRGNLHHYYIRSSLRQVNPFNQREYESIALFAMIVAGRSIAQKIYEINKLLGLAKD
ncbi:MAG: hypothetical protein E3J56_06265 [Candidatus Aminicenantes bacterium]|nr:MAG: hypothetical protein E3J56_06265 [Candidatus Aminicenantes bacterium]